MTFDEWFQSKQGTPYYSYYDFAKDALNAAQAAEREACAKVCDDHRNRTKGSLSASAVTQWAANECAAAIRARGNK